MFFSGLMLYLMALLQEDVGIVTAGFFVADGRVPFPLALVLVYSGVLTNNFLIYGIGTLARRLPQAQRWLIDERVERLRRKLQQRLVPAVLLCRLTPGLQFSTFIGCGWLRVSFPRFALLVAMAAGVYVPIMLLLVVTFGNAVLQRLGEWIWLIPAAVLLGVLIAMRGRIWAWVRRTRR